MLFLCSYNIYVDIVYKIYIFLNNQKVSTFVHLFLFFFPPFFLRKREKTNIEIQNVTISDLGKTKVQS